MNPYLIVQSIGDEQNDRFKPYMDLERPVHEEYAERCGADYEFFVGWKEAGTHPTWNRIPMILDGFDAGYEKVFWMDADTLAVDLDRNVFTETPDAPFVMTRVQSAHVDMPWEFDAEIRRYGLCGALTSPPSERRCALEREDYGVSVTEQRAGTKAWHVGDHRDGDGTWPQWDVYNDGVLLAKNCDEARAGLDFAWANRKSQFAPWHVPGMPELDWLLDWVFDHPDHVAELHERWNWHYVERCPREEAVIMAWHGEPGQLRWERFVAAYREFYG